MPKAGTKYNEKDYENKSTSLKNWLQDENLDRAAGIKPTHPGRTIDDNPRWNGVGKGDGFRPHDEDQYQDNLDKIYGEEKERLKDVIKTTYKAGGEVIYKVSTEGGIVNMTEEEYKEYLQD
jgi:hypothetical protein